MALSMGLPSRYWSAETAGDIPNHIDTLRDPAIRSHVTGSQSAQEVRTFRSRSSTKRPRIPKTKRIAATGGGIRVSPGALLINVTDSL